MNDPEPVEGYTDAMQKQRVYFTARRTNGDTIAMFAEYRWLPVYSAEANVTTFVPGRTRIATIDGADCRRDGKGIYTVLETNQTLHSREEEAP